MNKHSFIKLAILMFASLLFIGQQQSAKAELVGVAYGVNKAKMSTNMVYTSSFSCEFEKTVSVSNGMVSIEKSACQYGDCKIFKFGEYYIVKNHENFEERRGNEEDRAKLFTRIYDEGSKAIEKLELPLGKFKYLTVNQFGMNFDNRNIPKTEDGRLWRHSVYEELEVSFDLQVGVYNENGELLFVFN